MIGRTCGFDRCLRWSSEAAGEEEMSCSISNLYTLQFEAISLLPLLPVVSTLAWTAVELDGEDHELVNDEESESFGLVESETKRREQCTDRQVYWSKGCNKEKGTSESKRAAMCTVKCYRDAPLHSHVALLVIFLIEQQLHQLKLLSVIHYCCLGASSCPH